MKPSNQLFDIIQSLTPEEVKYFQSVSSLQQGDKNYLKLFNFISQQEAYDEEALKEHFKAETFIRHLPSEKNQLLHQILKSLRNYRNESVMSAYINEQVKNIQILINKSLYKQGRKFLNQAKRMAYTYELFYLILEIIDLEKVLIDIEAHFGEINYVSLDELIEEENDVFTKIENLAHYQVLHSRLNSIATRLMIARSTEDVSQIERILNDPSLLDLQAPLSVKAQVTALQVRAQAARLLKHSQDMLDASLELIRLLDNNPELISEMPKSYVVSHGAMIRYYAMEGVYTEGFKTIDKLKALVLNPVFKSTDLQIAIFSNSYITEMLLYTYTGQHDNAKNVIPAVIKGLDKYETKINDEELVRIYHTITMVYFGVGEYSKALHWVNKIINTNYDELRQDTIRISKLINLIIHFELGNEDLLPYIFKSTQRYLNNQNIQYRFEQVFLDNFKKIALSKRDGKQAHAYVRFKEELQKVFSDPFERNSLEFFNFYAWLDSKIHNISFSDAIKIRKQTL